MEYRHSKPQFLNLIFHGPWGFVVDKNKNQICAYAAECNCHTYLMGDTPVLGRMPAGQYSFTNSSSGKPPISAYTDAPCGLTQTEAKTAPITVPTMAGQRSFCLPWTDLHPGKLAPRSLPVAGGDNILSGADFGQLNFSTGTAAVYLAANQILPYKIMESLELTSDQGQRWVPAQHFNNGRQSVNLHIIAQDMAATPGIPSSQHFTDMARLFGLGLSLRSPVLSTVTEDPHLPPGTSDDDLGDLGKNMPEFSANTYQPASPF